MADETVASLGFEVNSKPLDDAKQKLAEVSTEANKTGKAVEDFNQKVGNTGAAATKAADGVGKVGPALGAIESAANRAGVSVETMRARTAAFSAETAKLASSTQTAGAAIGTIAKEASSVAPALSAVGAATAAVVKEHEAHNAALTGLRGNLKAMSPLLNQFGGGLGDLVQYSRAARLGLVGFAAVAGGAAILALEKLGDEIERTKNHFAGLTGSVEGGAKAYEAVKAAAKASGIEISALTGAVDGAIIGQEKFADKNVQYADSADRVAKKTAEVSAAFGTFGSIMQANLATAEQENRALRALGDSFEKTGTLTTDAFNKIRNQSASTAQAVANAFGFKTVQEFVRELDKAPISLDQFVKVMARVKPQVDTTFDPEKPKTFEQALRGVTAAGNDLLETLAKAGAFDIFKNILIGTKKEVEGLTHPLETLAKTFEEAGQKSEHSWGSFVSFAKDQNSIFGTSMTVDVEGAVIKSLAILGRLPGEGIASITSWANSAISEFNRMAQGAVSAATTATNALAGIVKAGAGGMPQTDPYGNVLSGSGGASSGVEGIQLSPQGTDAGAAGFDLGMADLPAFAGGGQLAVTGTGGTDSQLVAFKATPGEVVTVSTPDQLAGQTSSVQSLTSATTAVPTATATVKDITDAIDQSTIDLAKKVLEGSDKIVLALNKLIGGVASTTVNPSTGLPIASTNMIRDRNGALVSATDTGGGGGGGISGIKNMNKDYAAEAARIQKYQDDINRKFGGGGAYGYPDEISRGYGGSVRGGQSSGAASFPTMAPTGQFAPVNPNYSPTNSNSGYSTGAYGGDPYASDAYGPMAPYDSGSSSAAVGSSVFGANSTAGTYGSSSFDGTGFSPSDSNLGFMPGTTSGFPDSTATTGLDSLGPQNFYGGGSVDAGYFATGGSFPVPGSPGGGIDKTLVKLHATPGETVTVTPLSSNVAAANADPSSLANVTNKTININVQAGIQAESFIRSRAMIARGL